MFNAFKILGLKATDISMLYQNVLTWAFIAEQIALRMICKEHNGILKNIDERRIYLTKMDRAKVNKITRVEEMRMITSF